MRKRVYHFNPTPTLKITNDNSQDIVHHESSNPEIILEENIESVLELL